MPSRSSKQNKRRRGSRRNQKGGNEGVPQISEATLKQAGEIAQKLLGQSMQQGNNNAQTGGSASGAAPQSGASSAPSAPLQNAMVGGAVAGAVAGAAAAAEAAEPKSALNMSPLVGGRGRGRRRSGRQSQSQNQNQNQSESENQSQNQNQNQTGGMVPGLMAAVETALVPLGLYIGQKALQSRRSGKSFARSFNFRKFSRRNRSSRRR
jgi:hypothetical protein